jgi:hypothetical protein
MRRASAPSLNIVWVALTPTSIPTPLQFRTVGAGRGCANLTVSILLDSPWTAGDISWSVTMQGSKQVLAQGGPTPMTVVPVCAPVGATLEFTISDRAGDGLYPCNGQGSYSVTMGRAFLASRCVCVCVGSAGVCGREVWVFVWEVCVCVREVCVGAVRELCGSCVGAVWELCGGCVGVVWGLWGVMWGMCVWVCAWYGCGLRVVCVHGFWMLSRNWGCVRGCVGSGAHYVESGGWEVGMVTLDHCPQSMRDATT